MPFNYVKISFIRNALRLNLLLLKELIERRTNILPNFNLSQSD